LFDYWNFKVYFYQNKLTHILKDTAKHQGLRNQLVNLLIEKGITDKGVLEAIKKLPRHLFLNSSFADYAYQDKAFPIGAGQTISQPYTVAFQSQLLEVKKEDKILEIGTGSGYQTAVLFLMGAKVYSIERQNELFKQTSVLLPKLGIRPKHLSFGDGYRGLPNHAPFDSIIVTAGAPVIPQALMAQLKIGGRLVIPLGEENQIMTLLIRKNETQFEKHEFGDFKFVPLLENKN
jgi:protein-L-isoaspartate(D-aspartate) O-methyltransferase